MTATALQDQSSTVTWLAPFNTGGSPILSYTVTAHDLTSPGTDGDGTTCVDLVRFQASTTCSFAGLTDGDTYTFTVVATNGYGDSPASSASAPTLVATVPGAPSNVTGTANQNASSTISWAVPAWNGGAAITSYTVTASPGGRTCTTTGSSCVVRGLINGCLLYTSDAADE